MLIAPVTFECIRTGVPVDSGEPFFRVADNRLEYDGISFPPNANLIPGKPKFLRQSYRLAVSVAEEFGGFGHN
jgi:hypothetical protein